MFKHWLSSLTPPMLGSLRRWSYRSYGRSSSGFTSLSRKGCSQEADRTRIKAVLSYGIPTVLVGAVGGFAYRLHQNDVKRSIPQGQGKSQGGVAPAGAAIGGPFTLVSSENKVFTEQDFGGKWVLLYFGYTSSPESGPTEVQKMAKTVDILESKHKIKILPVFVTIDPKRDSTSHLKAYLKEFDPRIVGLTGTNAAVKQMAQQYRVFFRKVDEDGDDYLVEFSHNLYLINPNREIVRTFHLKSSEEERSEQILKEIKQQDEIDLINAMNSETISLIGRRDDDRSK